MFSISPVASLLDMNLPFMLTHSPATDGSIVRAKDLRFGWSGIRPGHRRKTSADVPGQSEAE